MQEPRLACHAAPAQPQRKTLNDDPVWGDMDSLLRGPGGQQQVSQAPARTLCVSRALPDAVHVASGWSRPSIKAFEESVSIPMLGSGKQEHG